jgi:hypothetical protein
LPSRGISREVKHRQHDNLVVRGAIEDRIRKPTQQHAANVLVDDRVLLRRALKRLDRGLNGARERRT